MRYPATEKLEIIRTVETSPLSMRRTLEQIGIPKSTFYSWLDRHAVGGLEGLEDRKPRPRRVWNRIGEAVRRQVIALALDEPELSPREVVVAASRLIDLVARAAAIVCEAIGLPRPLTAMGALGSISQDELGEVDDDSIVIVVMTVTTRATRKESQLALGDDSDGSDGEIPRYPLARRARWFDPN
jgi:transposase-like protein